MTDTEAAPVATAISIPAPKLGKMLAAVMPHAGSDEDLPTLTSVCFEVRDGVLYLIATDRYSMGIARYPLPGAHFAPVPDAASWLPLEAAGTLADLAEANEHELVALVIKDDEILADAAGATWSAPAYTSGWVPDWRKPVAEALAAPAAELGDDFGVDAVLLGRLNGGGEDWDPCEPDALKVRVTRPASMGGPVVLFTRSDWFLGVVMACRCTPEYRHSPLPQWESWAKALTPAEVLA